MPAVKSAKTVVAALLLMVFFSSAALGGDTIEAATFLLERWTSFHWGRDCLVWIVHYPEELVDPWVEAEALRSGMSESEKQEYRKAFVSELRILDTEPFLVTVYAFGSRPLDLGGFASAIRLEGKNGEKIAPLSYERKFDQPLSGIVQGLVFFPKQADKNFSVVMRRLGIHEEQIFAFAARPSGSPVAEGPDAKGKEVVVVELPPAPKKDTPRPKVPKEPEPAADIPPPVAAQPADLAELKPAPPAVPVVPGPVKDDGKKNVVFISRDKTLEKFVQFWIDGNTSGMYGLLSSSTRTALSEEQFRKQVSATGLRWSLKDGYKVQWQDGDRARVVTAQKMLIFRTLRSKMLSLAKEDKIWKVTW